MVGADYMDFVIGSVVVLIFVITVILCHYDSQQRPSGMRDCTNRHTALLVVEIAGKAPAQEDYQWLKN